MYDTRAELEKAMEEAEVRVSARLGEKKVKALAMVREQVDLIGIGLGICCRQVAFNIIQYELKAKEPQEDIIDLLLLVIKSYERKVA